MSVCVCISNVHMEDNLKKLVLFFYHMGPRGQVQVVRLSGKCHYPPSHLAGL